ncbi:MAG: hypothetical protein ACOC9P_02260 [bacterium]
MNRPSECRDYTAETACRERMARIDQVHRFDLRWTDQLDQLRRMISDGMYDQAHIFMNNFKEK